MVVVSPLEDLSSTAQSFGSVLCGLYSSPRRIVWPSTRNELVVCCIQGILTTEAALGGYIYRSTMYNKAFIRINAPETAH
jgi:hypothetical protein